MMRVLALDYGRARCGCALSDPTGTIVTPIEVVANPASKRGMAAIQSLTQERDVQRVVVGLPLSLRGDDTAQTRETRLFAERLSRRLGAEIPVELHDERLTTKMAQRMRGASSSEDSRAAAHMLESWLTSRPQ
jgi:putative Holliday junction resolvase